MENNTNKSLGLLLIFFCFITSKSYSIVSLQNGNYYHEIQPIVLPNSPLKLWISYNSKSQHSGLFGYGWGSEYETRLVSLAEGGVVIHEIGGADPNRYTPEGNQTQKIAQAVDRIMKAAKRNDKTLRDKLLQDAEERDRYAEKYKIQSPLGMGVTLLNARRRMEKVTVTKDGYVRTYINEGRNEYFDKLGRLYFIKNKNDTTVKIDYNRDGISALSDKSGNKINIALNSGKVAKLWTSANQSLFVSFKYDTYGNLTEFTNEQGKKRTYQYDPKGNMKFIAFEDGTNEVIRYDRTGNWVVEVQNRNGRKISYQQWFEPGKPLEHMKQTLTIKNPNSPPVKDVYEYWSKFKPSGELWLEKMSSVVNGEITTKEYEQNSGLVIRETSNKRGVTTYQYNDSGQVLKQNNPDGSFKEYAYDPKSKKPTLIKEGLKIGNQIKVSWVKVEYDSRDRISTVSNHNKQSVQISYDANSRIQTIKDSNSRVVSFGWNANDKPVKIEQKGVGTVTVKYNADGTIQSADSPQGRSIASQVSTNLQQILSIVEPAGISL